MVSAIFLNGASPFVFHEPGNTNLFCRQGRQEQTVGGSYRQAYGEAGSPVHAGIPIL